MTEEQWEGLLNFLSEGGSVVKFARQSGENEETVRSRVGKRLRNDDEFATKYARAKQQGIELRLDRLADMIERSDPAEVAKTRLLWDHERWEASKLNAKKYGDRSTIALENVTTDKLIDVLVQTEDK